MRTIEGNAQRAKDKGVEGGPELLKAHPRYGYDGYVTTVKIAELKNNLSRYLARVRRGGVIAVYDRDTPVARIVPFVHEEPAETPAARRGNAASATAERIATLVRQGVVSPGNPHAVADWLNRHQPLKRPAGAPSAVDLLLETRRGSTR